MDGRVRNWVKKKEGEKDAANRYNTVKSRRENVGQVSGGRSNGSSVVVELA